MRNAIRACFSLVASLLATVPLLFACAPIAASAATYKVIDNLDPTTVGGSDYSLVADSAGRLFGSGTWNYGNVFVLIPPSTSSGTWKNEILYNGTNVNGPNAVSFPNNLSISKGALLGTATLGAQYGLGAVFQIVGGQATPPVVLHNFQGTQVTPPDGAAPVSGLTPGPNGLLYGATEGGGGAKKTGTIFAISPPNAPPSYSVLHRFDGPGDGFHPTSGKLIIDGNGRIYGLTSLGGANGVGTVYALQRVNGAWQEQVLYSFNATNDVFSPYANLVIDAHGSLYGCAQGGANGLGGVFKLSPPAQSQGAWSESVIYSFVQRQAINVPGQAGCGMAIDPATNRLFGTAYSGGYDGRGSIWELDPPAAGQTTWTNSLIHSFTGLNHDGQYPIAPPLKVGNTYYGTTTGSQNTGAGPAVYQFTP